MRWLKAIFSAFSKPSGGVSKKAVAGVTAGAFTAAAVAFVGPWEGQKTEAYLDRIANPPVWTVCYGETRGVQRGDRYTPEQCKAMLAVALQEYHDDLAKCIPALPQQSVEVRVALSSWAYNVGVGAGCSSTLAKRANAGRWKEACDQLLRWDKAGGVTVRGLTNRRQAEHRLCLSGL